MRRAREEDAAAASVESGKDTRRSVSSSASSDRARADSVSDQPTRAAPMRRRPSAEQAVGADGFRRYQSALARLEARDRRAVRGRIELQQPYEALARSLGVASAAAARDVVTRALGRLIEGMSR